ncbi:hypothetical protein GF380_00010 [Candidatus Uhrbacteria bacterium]|nr:hypothetical protein [Candidatus Uhrbacteria bacterium]MBD3283809.1 hypothetical protein [Candidatus Uhrbacteria bacterium]
MTETTRIALVNGDGIGPECMVQAIRIIGTAAETFDKLRIIWAPAPMGWNAFQNPELEDTFPQSSFETCKRCKIVYFGAVGDKELDKTLGEKYPHMKPERRALIDGLRYGLNLLINLRVFRQGDVNQHWGRYLLEDGYMGDELLRRLLELKGVPGVPDDVTRRVTQHAAEQLGLKFGNVKVADDEELVGEFAYYTKTNLEAYARYLFQYAKDNELPVLNLHKANVLRRSKLWKQTIDRVHAQEFSDIPYAEQFIDAANALLVAGTLPNGVILAGNEHGDIGSDGAAGLKPKGKDTVPTPLSLGEMYSASINPTEGYALFESGAGTACDIAGQNKANPVGRILAGAEMLQFIGATEAAKAVRYGVQRTKEQGFVTTDLASPAELGAKDPCILGTKEISDKILQNMLDA